MIEKLKKINYYYKQRFQWWVIIPLLLAVNLSLVLVNIEYISIWKFSLVLINLCLVNLWQYFFIRVLDEKKDYQRDIKIHPNRPVSSGKVTLKFLNRVLIVKLCIIMIINVISYFIVIESLNFSFIFLFLPYVFVYLWGLLSKNNFFMKNLEKDFLRYNLINTYGNLVCLFSSFLFAYGVGFVSDSILIYRMPIIMIFVALGSLLLEVVRKIESIKPDSYISNLGLGETKFLVRIIIGSMIILLFQFGFYYLIILPLALITFFFISSKFIKNIPDLKASKNLKLSTYLFYLTLLLIICLL